MNPTPTPTSASAPHAGTSSLYGHDMLAFVADFAKHADSALKVANYVMTHGERCRLEDARDAFNYGDLAAYEVLAQMPSLALSQEPAAFAMYINSLGRLHIRPSDAEKPVYDQRDSYLVLGFVDFDATALAQFDELHKQYLQQEASAYSQVLAVMQNLQEKNELEQVLEQVIDHVEHVESVCFYVRDRFFGLIERFVNLIDTKAGPGHLSALRNVRLENWHADDVLMVAALHALFHSGRSVRFEEFNGVLLSADRLVKKLHTLYARYVELGCVALEEPGSDLFALAFHIRKQTLQAVGKPWLRYRRTYGLNFQKTESILDNMVSTEDPLVYMQDFGEDYRNLVSSNRGLQMPEGLFFTQLASACLAQDINGVAPPVVAGSAASSWLETLMEKIVASAVRATRSDYGMSSSLRNLKLLMHGDDETLAEAIHAFTPANFFTCFVSRDFTGSLEKSDANLIATSVQKRMMFNRWHFIPGNLERPLVLSSRHWYYPPMIPDIATHADVHRAAHARARVKFSIRTPGPDMSRQPLRIVNHDYRGFYDVRVVRMEGPEYDTQDMLRCRRRTLWLEAVYSVLVSYLHETHSNTYTINGFKAGTYLDLNANNDLPHWSAPNHDAIEAQPNASETALVSS